MASAAARVRAGIRGCVTLGAPPLRGDAGPIHVYAFATAHCAESHNFLVSCDEASLPAALVGVGSTWSRADGFRKRMEFYASVARAHVAHAPTDVLVMCDAYDVVCTAAHDGGAPAALLAAWRALGAQLVFGAERLCVPTNCRALPDAWWHATGAPRATDYRHVNAGFAMGTAAALLAFYEWALERPFTDDQLAAGAYVAAHAPTTVTVDTGRALVWNHFDGSETPPLRPGGAPPFFKHCPGLMPQTRAVLKAAYAAHAGPRAILGKKEMGQYNLAAFAAAGAGVVLLLAAAVYVLGRRHGRMRATRAQRQAPQAPQTMPQPAPVRALVAAAPHTTTHRYAGAALSYAPTPRPAPLTHRTARHE